MLQGILMILKIIGIIALVILGILILAVCLILFVPVRYKVRIKSGDGFDESAHASWLFHLLSFRQTYRDSEFGGELRLAGKTLKTFGSAEKDYGRGQTGRKKRKRQGKKVKVSGDAAEREAKPKESSEKAESRPGIHAAANKASPEMKDPEKKYSEMKSSEIESSSGEKSADKDAGNGSVPEEFIRRIGEIFRKFTSWLKEVLEKFTGAIEKLGDDLRKRKSSAAREKNKTKKLDIEGAFRKAAQKAGEVLLEILNALFSLSDHVDNVSDKIEKIGDFQDKAEPFLTMSAFDIYGLILRKLKKLLAAYLPRKAEGYVRFGLDRPDLTGVLAGVIYRILPADSGKFEVSPDFHDTVLDADMTLSGSIRLNHAAGAAISLIVRKDFWKLIRQIKQSRGGARHG